MARNAASELRRHEGEEEEEEEEEVVVVVVEEEDMYELPDLQEARSLWRLKV